MGGRRPVRMTDRDSCSFADDRPGCRVWCSHDGASGGRRLRSVCPGSDFGRLERDRSGDRRGLSTAGATRPAEAMSAAPGTAVAATVAARSPGCPGSFGPTCGTATKPAGSLVANLGQGHMAHALAGFPGGRRWRRSGGTVGGAKSVVGTHREQHERVLRHDAPGSAGASGARRRHLCRRLGLPEPVQPSGRRGEGWPGVPDGRRPFSADIETSSEGTYLTARRVSYYLSLVRAIANDRPVIATVPRPTSYWLAHYPYGAEAPFIDAYAPMVYWSCTEPGAAVHQAIVALSKMRPVAPIGQDYNMGRREVRLGCLRRSRFGVSSTLPTAWAPWGRACTTSNQGASLSGRRSHNIPGHPG